MLTGEPDTKKTDTEYIGYEERNKLLWSLRSDFAWAGKKIPESVEIEGQEYRLKDLVRELGEKESLNPDEVSESKGSYSKAQSKGKSR